MTGQYWHFLPACEDRDGPPGVYKVCPNLSCPNTQIPDFHAGVCVDCALNAFSDGLQCVTCAGPQGRHRRWAQLRAANHRRSHRTGLGSCRHILGCLLTPLGSFEMFLPLSAVPTQAQARFCTSTSHGSEHGIGQGAFSAECATTSTGDGRGDFLIPKRLFVRGML